MFCIRHSFAYSYVAHYVFFCEMSGVEPMQSATVASKCATNLATQLPNLAAHLPNLATHLPLRKLGINI